LRSGLFARWVTASVLTTDLLGTFFISRLFLRSFIAQDTLIPASGRAGHWLWHALLSAVLPAHILRTFEIVPFRHEMLLG
jgi:hypothetical protein